MAITVIIVRVSRTRRVVRKGAGNRCKYGIGKGKRKATEDGKGKEKGKGKATEDGKGKGKGMRNGKGKGKGIVKETAGVQDISHAVLLQLLKV